MTLAAASLAQLRSTFRGEIVGPSDPGYDDARRVWSALYDDRRPALIVRPLDVEDVVAAVRFGRETDLLIAVRGGGHSISGHSTCDGGLVLDLSRMRGVTIDPGARRARANGGALLSELDRAAQDHDLVCPVGSVGHTGIAGLALGGGVGRLQRRFGLTLDNLTAVELVTADGRLVRASEDAEPDLFWAIRGAGPNFGVVTSLEFRLHPFGHALVRGVRIYRPEDGLAAWHAFGAALDGAPRELGLSFVIGRAVPADEYEPEIAGGTIAIIAFTFAGTEEAAQTALAPLARSPRPVMETTGPKPYLEIQGAYDEAYGWGQRYYAFGAFADDLRDETIDALIGHVADGPGDPGFTASAQGGAIADLPESAMAFSGRSARFRTMADSVWDDAKEDERAAEWCRGAMVIAEPDSIQRRYVNEVFEDGTDPATIYGSDKLERLIALKRAWDPQNVFRSNHNIVP